MVHAYNCTKQDTTGFAPYYLMYGREPILPVDYVFGVQRNHSESSLTKYAQKLKTRLQTAYDLATANTEKAQKRQKSGYDQRIRNAVIEPGDEVLVKIVAFDGKHKLADKWEDQPYTILRKPNQDIPVYVVRRTDGEGRTRTLHRNLLLPLNTRRNVPAKPIPKPRLRQKEEFRHQRNTAAESSIMTNDETDSEGDMDIVVTETNIPRDDTEHNGTDEDSESEDDGDALSSTSGEPDEQEADEAEPQPEPEVIPEPPPRPAPRRTQRVRRPPQWITSGEYVMAAQNQPEWVQRAEYLRNIASTGILNLKEDDINSAFLQIVTNRTGEK